MPGEAEERLLHDVLGGVAIVDEDAGEAHERAALEVEETHDELFGLVADVGALGAPQRCWRRGPMPSG